MTEAKRKMLEVSSTFRSARGFEFAINQQGQRVRGAKL
jgi:hypothetical protein